MHPVYAPTFNATMQNKIDHANRILRLMDGYPNMTVKQLLYLIECRIEGGQVRYFLISLVRTDAAGTIR